MSDNHRPIPLLYLWAIRYNELKQQARQQSIKSEVTPIPEPDTTPSKHSSEGPSSPGQHKTRPGLILRRPTALHNFYSPACTEEQWNKLAPHDPRRWRYTHIGQIEELPDAGKNCFPACARCSDRHHVCRRYTPKARANYEGAGGMNKCSRCRYSGQKCVWPEKEHLST